MFFELQAKAKQMWGSEEQEEDILDRFLKVKKFQVNLINYTQSIKKKPMTASKYLEESRSKKLIHCTYGHCRSDFQIGTCQLMFITDLIN